MNTIFFSTRNYYIGKKRKSLRSPIKFRIYNDKRECIGYITNKKTFLQKIIGLNILPSVFEIRNANGVLKVSLLRTYPSFYATIIIMDDRGKKVGSIKQQFSLFRQNLKILNASNEFIGAICCNKKESCFTINNMSKDEIGEIKQRESRNALSRSGSSYDVVIEEIYSNAEDQIAVLASALAINMILQMIL